MTELEVIRAGRHCVFAMHVHLVFVTKFRHNVFTDRHLSRMEQIMRDVCADFEAELVGFNGEAESCGDLACRRVPEKCRLGRDVQPPYGGARR
ncbi:transposase [Micromonospora chersina]|uniref:transposase n=1 Tax=Micromonospora chersina TaxID=47854 RepID=UPI00371E226A